MRILLVQPDAPGDVAFSVRDRVAMAEPLALEYVAAGARLDGHEVKLLDLRLHPADLDATLGAYQPDLVGLTGFSMHALRALSVCARAKELVPGCRTAVGGVHATFEPQDFYEPQIDFVFVGQGIRAFREVLKRLGAGQPLDGIPGLHARVDGVFKSGGDAEFGEELPRPDRTIAPTDRGSYVIEHMKPIAMMRTSVGCPYRCTFCSVWRMTDGRYFTDDLDQVVDELRSIPEKFVHFVDDEPFVQPKRMRELAERIKAAGIQKEYFLYCRIDSFLNHFDVIQQWAEIGLRCLFIGAESVFKDELDRRYNKGGQVVARLDEVALINTKAKELGIVPYFGFIVHPSYTEAEFEGTKQFIKDRALEYPSFTVWTPLPGIQDGGTNYDDVIDRQPNGRPDWSKFDFFHPVTPTTLPKDEFMSQFNGLFRDLTSHASRGADDERQRLEQQLKEHYMKLMRLAFSAKRPPAKTEG